MSKLKLAQIVDYNIQRHRYIVIFRYEYRKIEGLQGFTWLSKEQEKAVREWWYEHGSGGALENRMFFEEFLPEEYHFWKQELPKKDTTEKE